MKVYIGPHPQWIGPYQIAEKLLFWMDKYEDRRVHKFGEWLAGGKDKDSVLMKVCTWISSKQNRKVKVKLHGYDSWNADGTLTLIILPLLKQLQKNQHGSPMVDDEDVPESMRLTVREDWSEQLQLDLSMSETEREKYEKESWDIVHVRWKWVLEQIIWSFEQLHPDSDWEAQFHSGNSDIVWAPSDMLDAEGEPLTYTMDRGPNDTHKFDIEGYRAHSDRINLGLKLFGKYYRGLWD